MRGAALLLGGLLLCIGGQAQAASGQGDLEVTQLVGREVTMVMPVPGGSTGGTAIDSGAIDSGAIDSAVVLVDGVTIAARASLDEPTASTRRSGPTIALLVMDTSGSMDGERITAARKAASSFVEGLPADISVGLVTFADQARLVQAPTLDRGQVLAAIADVQAKGDTALRDALALAANSLPPDALARMVLLSDGADTSSSTPLQEALESVALQGSPVDIIALQPTRAERAVLDRIAGVNGGRVLTAAKADELGSAFQAAGESFDRLATFRVTIPDGMDARSAPVQVTARIGPTQVTGTTTLPDVPSLARITPPAPSLAPAALVLPAYDPAWVALAVGAFVAILAGGLAWILLNRRRRHRDRVEQLTSYQVGPTRPADAGSSSTAWLDRALERSGRARRMRAGLGAAEIPLSPGAWLLVRIGASLLLALVGGLLLGSFVGAVIGIAFGWILTWAVVRARSSRRQQAFAVELPDFLLLLASALRGGLSFNHALEAAALEGKGEVPRQMRRVLRQVQVGSLLDDALMECADRMDSEDLRWTVTALSIQREVGGNLSTILDNAAATIKAREELRREVSTLSAEGRLSAYILIGLPLGVMAFLAIVRRPYVELLWTTGLGIIMLCLMGALMVLGWFWMRAIVRIKP